MKNIEGSLHWKRLTKNISSNGNDALTEGRALYSRVGRDDQHAFVAGINHIMDMMRTMTNVTGDATIAVAVGRMAGEIDVEEYISADDV